MAESAAVPGPANRTGALFLISVVGLFLELLLIRWIGTEIRIFAYLQNTVLVVCFLGLGMGCWTCRRPASLRDVAVPLALLCLLLTVPFTRAQFQGISQLLSVLPDFIIWDFTVTQSPGEVWRGLALGLALTLGLMVLLWDVFLPVGRILGRLLDDHPRPLWAYSVNVAGSLAGIWLFVLASALGLPPWAWFAVLALLAVPFLGPAWRAEAGLLAAVVGLTAFSNLVLEPRAPAGPRAEVLEIHWSPYQKLVLERRAIGPEADPFTVFEVNVNNTTYQTMRDLRPETLARMTALFPAEVHGLNQYDLPTRFKPRPGAMLIVGAGSGNDAAGGLRGGAARVVAVDIDPVILDLGRRFHPERPYADPRVEPVTADARAYFVNCAEKFDLIVFGLLDAHTSTAMANTRLDHYVYTLESLRQARALLAPGGVMVLTFAAQKPFIADRMAAALRLAFDGREPFVFEIAASAFDAGGTVFVAGDLDGVRREIAADPRLAARLAAWQAERPVALPGVSPVTTDDWPYLYLDRPRIPTLYFLLAGLLAVLLALSLGRLKVPGLLTGWGREDLHFAFLGAAFMLLEVQNISRAAVALGNTWLVNAVIISGILCMILVANAVTIRWPGLPAGVAYAGLLGSCVGLYFVDLAWFVGLPYGPRAAAVGLLTSLPMLFSGVVFARSFAAAAGKDRALGANLLGSLAGGLLQAATFVTGVQALLLGVAVLYLAAWATRPLPAAGGAPVPAKA